MPPAPSDISPVPLTESSKPASPPAPPKSWADLVRSKTVPKPSSTASAASQLANGLGPAKNETLSDVLNTIEVTATHTAAKIAFLKPRGLVNTGNMCYMNSVCK
jgi:ubiquitin carboxyl-terminal hydrolase 10